MIIEFFYRDRGGKIWHNHQPKRRLPKSLMISSCIASHDPSRTIKRSEDRLHKVLSKLSTHSPIMFIRVFGLQVNTHQFIIPRNIIGSCYWEGQVAHLTDIVSSKMQ